MRGCKGGEGRTESDEKRIPKLDHVGDGRDPRLPPQSVQRVERNGSPSSIHPSAASVLPPTCPPKIPNIPIEGEHQLETPSASQPTTTSAFDPRLSPFLSSTNLLSTSLEVNSSSTYRHRHGLSLLLPLPDCRSPRVGFSSHGRGPNNVKFIITDPSFQRLSLD